MSLADRWRSCWGDDTGPVLSKEEAIEKVRQYAEVNHLSVDEPVDGHIEIHWMNQLDHSQGNRKVYVLGLGDHRPMTVVEVDATDGIVIAWRTFPR